MVFPHDLSQEQSSRCTLHIPISGSVVKYYTCHQADALLKV